MTKDRDPKAEKPSRADRLAENLKANLARRKAQIRDRGTARNSGKSSVKKDS